MSTATRIRTGRKPLRILSREPSSPGQLQPGADHILERTYPTVADHVKASPHLQAVVGIRHGNRTQHREEELLGMVARFLLESGKDYPRAEVLEVLLCFTGCSSTAAEEALRVMVDHGTVTAVNEVIRVTW